ncbi:MULTISPECIES: hypothetical protein [Cupriavidus]|uniref:hypothetical protein n=1 Tax=Cupriavidus TaxID=106589 RepID=UPI0011EBF25D|nr:hypothetical protein [Cupriavidus campinensis]
MQNPFQIAMQNGENSAEAVRGALVWRLRVSCRVNSCANGAGPSVELRLILDRRAPKAGAAGAGRGPEWCIDSKLRPQRPGLLRVRRTIRAGPEK